MNETDKIEQLCELYNQMVNQYGKLEKELHYYADGAQLHLSEVHTIVTIGKYDNINITCLAKIQGISKSAVSQMVSKLVKKGFIKKSLSPKTDNEVILCLTELGLKVFQEHEKQHQWLQEQLMNVFKKYPNVTIDVLTKLASEIQELWKNLPRPEQ